MALSGSLDLAGHLLRELDRQLSRTLKDLRRVERGRHVRSAVKSLASAVTATAANKVGVPSDVVAALPGQHKRSLHEAKETLSSALTEADFLQRVIVIVDDVDRLQDDEIRELVRVLRVVADLPRVTYILAYDRERLEDVLGNGDRGRGRAYMEKIIHESHDLPPVWIDDLDAMLFAEAEATTALDGTTWTPRTSQSFREELKSRVAPFIRTPRDIRRFVRGLSAAVELVGDDVALEDLLGLEALRVFAPDAHAMLVSHRPESARIREALTGVPDSIEGRELALHDLDAFFNADAARSPDVRRLAAQLFPQYEMLASGRLGSHLPSVDPDQVARPSVLSIYSLRQAPPGLLRPSVRQRVVQALEVDDEYLPDALADVPDDAFDELLVELATGAGGFLRVNPGALGLLLARAYGRPGPFRQPLVGVGLRESSPAADLVTSVLSSARPNERVAIIRELATALGDTPRGVLPKARFIALMRSIRRRLRFDIEEDQVVDEITGETATTISATSMLELAADEHFMWLVDFAWRLGRPDDKRAVRTGLTSEPEALLAWLIARPLSVPVAAQNLRRYLGPGAKEALSSLVAEIDAGNLEDPGRGRRAAMNAIRLLDEEIDELEAGGPAGEVVAVTELEAPGG